MSLTSNQEAGDSYIQAEKKTKYDLLREATDKWLDSEAGRQAISKAIKDAEDTKDLWKQGRRLPSEWRTKRINI